MARPLQAGDLDQRIVIEEPIIGRDSLNAAETVWSELADVAAKVAEVQGREFLKGDGVQAESKATFTIRYRAGIDGRMRVLWNGQTFGIEDVTGTRREGWTWLHCRAVTAANRVGIEEEGS